MLIILSQIIGGVNIVVVKSLDEKLSLDELNKLPLLDQYIHGKKELRKMVKRLDPEDEANKEDIKVINSMIREMEFNIEWIETGIYPGEQDRTIRYSEFEGNSYWDESVEGYVSVSTYTNPFLEVERKIDKELEMMKNARSRRRNKKRNE